MAKRKAAHDPAAAMRHRLERQERDHEIARLTAMGAEITTDCARRVISARRSNAFTLLLVANAITTTHHDAATRFAEQWAAWKGCDGRETLGAKVDCGTTPPHTRSLVTDRMIAAGRYVNDTLDSLLEPDSRLLTALMVATVEEDRPMSWRGIVERIYGPPPKVKHAKRGDTQINAMVDMLDALAHATGQSTVRRAA